MPTHNGHDEIREHGLADGCPRCAEMSEDPFTTLDDVNLHNLIVRTLADRFNYGEVPMHARSDAEARAMAIVMTRLEQTGSLFRSSPHAVALYLNDRWRLPVTVSA